MIRRNTIQKELVLGAVRELRGHVTADEVYDHLSKSNPAISRGTVYRNLNVLSQEGQVKKVRTFDGADIFDFSLHNHYHAKCINCGEIYDIDMKDEFDPLAYISDNHGFITSGFEIFFSGVCQKCVSEKEEL